MVIYSSSYNIITANDIKRIKRIAMNLVSVDGLRSLSEISISSRSNQKFVYFNINDIGIPTSWEVHNRGDVSSFDESFKLIKLGST